MCNKLSREDEFERDHKQWDRYLAAANLEKDWTHQRLQWFLNPQAILFGAYALSYSKVDCPNSLVNFRIALCAVGILSAIAVELSVFSAAMMHRIWTKKMILYYLKYEGTKYQDDFTFGCKPYYPARFSRWVPVALILSFIIVWCFMLFQETMVYFPFPIFHPAYH